MDLRAEPTVNRDVPRLARMARNGPLGSAVALTLLLLTARCVAWDPVQGDITVWIFAHEWLSRGVPLYAGVWDHKDLGFFAVTHSFYVLDSIRGLYL